MNLEDLIKPGTIAVMEHRHDKGCPTMNTQNMDDCTCDEVEVVMVPVDLDELEP